MAEVDRLSTSGTYPALPMAGKRRSREESRNPGSGERREEGRGGDERPAETPGPAATGASNSLIDEYA